MKRLFLSHNKFLMILYKYFKKIPSKMLTQMASVIPTSLFTLGNTRLIAFCHNYGN